jgi:predicted transcriptional regulator
MTNESRSQDRHTTTVLPVRLPPDLREQIRQRAVEEERTQTQVIRRAIRHYLQHVPATP